MWWRLGQKKHCFARQGCSLNMKEELAAEDEEDAMDMARGKGLADIEIAAWFNARVPPLALWIAGRDELVDGQRLVRRFERDREPHAEVVHLSVLDEYEHLDVLWAMDSIDMVGREGLDANSCTSSSITFIRRCRTDVFERPGLGTRSLGDSSCPRPTGGATLVYHDFALW